MQRAHGGNKHQGTRQRGRKPLHQSDRFCDLHDNRSCQCQLSASVLARQHRSAMIRSPERKVKRVARNCPDSWGGRPPVRLPKPLGNWPNSRPRVERGKALRKSEGGRAGSPVPHYTHYIVARTSPSALAQGFNPWKPVTVQVPVHSLQQQPHPGVLKYRVTEWRPISVGY